jgi:hypothetical protein
MSYKTTPISKAVEVPRCLCGPRLSNELPVVPEFTGRIVEWDFAKGCGWLESDGQRIFLHWPGFAERRKRPAVGDVIRFTAATGPCGTALRAECRSRK